MSCSEDEYVDMINSFETCHLQSLLTAFGFDKNGLKFDLKNRVIAVLRKRIPTVHSRYLNKIKEIYNNYNLRCVSMKPQVTNDGSRNVMQIQRQQRVITIRARRAQARPGLPPVRLQTPITVNGNRTSGSNNIQSSLQQGGPRKKALKTDPNQPTTPVGNNRLHTDVAKDSNPFTTALANIKLMSSPFLRIDAELLKLSFLLDNGKCTLPTKAPIGTRETTFNITLTPEVATQIGSHRDISFGKNEYTFQVHIIICFIQHRSTELTDDNLPSVLHIRVNNLFLNLPKCRPDIVTSKILYTFDVTTLIKINPMIPNTFTVNWAPDSYLYAMGIYLVEKLTSETLLQKLNDKGTRRKEDTKNYIIKKLANIDPDIATTSYSFSLICPLGKKRIEIPAKSINCDHIQCFDARTFIFMNEQKPTWLCPTCAKPCLYDDILIESYFLDVVTCSDLPGDCEAIELLQDGTWRVYDENTYSVEIKADTEEKPMMECIHLIDDSDDENCLEDKNEQIPCSKESENLNDSLIIDLTLSDDDKNEPIPGCSKESENLNDSLIIDLTLSDDDKNEPIPGCSKESENLNDSFIDLTLNDDDNPPEEEGEQGTEAPAVDDAQACTARNYGRFKTSSLIECSHNRQLPVQSRE